MWYLNSWTSVLIINSKVICQEQINNVLVKGLKIQATNVSPLNLSPLPQFQQVKLIFTGQENCRFYLSSYLSWYTITSHINDCNLVKILELTGY